MQKFLALPRFPLTGKSMCYAPESPGIYGLFRDAELIYVGATGVQPERTIRTCLLAHLNGAKSRCTADATQYAWSITLSSAHQAAKILEQFKAEHHRLPQCNVEEAHPSG